MIFGRHEMCRQVSAIASAGIVVSIALLLPFAPSAAVGEPGSCTVSTFTSTDVPKAVPDPGGVESALAVPAGDSISAVDVGVTISHPFDSDLRIDLVSPAGTVVTLARTVGMWGDNFTGTTFDDGASTSIVSVLPPFRGRFRPAEPLSVLDGSPRAGAWRLRVTDERGRYAGQVQAWNLEITSCSSTRPAALAVPGAPDPPPLPTGVPAGAEPPEGALVTVSTNSDAANGDVSSVPNLQATPGPDGISLREAILATNNDPGRYTIHFGPTLVGTTIAVGGTSGEILPYLSSGGVFIDGDIDGDGRPDVTLANAVGVPRPGFSPWAVTLFSQGNRLHALAFEGFADAVVFTGPNAGKTLSENVVSGCVFDVFAPGSGINVYPGGDGSSGRDIRIVGNVFDHGGIGIAIAFISDALLHRITIAANTIEMSMDNPNGSPAISLGPGFDPASTNNSISETLVAYNTITGAPRVAIWLSSGAVGASGNIIEAIRVIGNRIRFSFATFMGGLEGNGVWLQTSDGGGEDNKVRNIVIDGNTVEGQGGAGVWLNPGGDRDSIDAVMIRGNVIGGLYADPQGVYIGGPGATDSSVSDVDVDANTITVDTTGRDSGALLTGGVIVTPAFQGAAWRNRIRDVRITNNLIDVAGLVGINLLGGVGGAEDAPAAEDNAVSKIRIAGNLITRAPTLLARYPWIKGINLVGGLAESGHAARNSVTSVTLADNLVAGVVDDVSVRSNFGPGASGNIAALGLRPPTLTAAKAGSGSGTVTSDPAGIDCGSTCSYEFDDRSQVTLTAQAAAGSMFGGWSGGGCSGRSTCVVTMDTGKTVSATFLALRTLVVGRSGSGAGAVRSTPAGIDCGSTCSNDFADGTLVTLAASASSGSTFAGWSGACSGAGPCTLTMDQNRSATATFESDKTLTVNKSGSGSGSVTVNPPGMSCGSSCTHSFGHGTTVTLSPQAAFGSRFAGWSGDCSGTRPCTLTMTRDYSATMRFEALCVVPKLRGKKLAAAKREIQAAKCSLGSVRRRYSAKKKGTVIAQTPAPGSRVAQGSRVGLVVSRGKRS